MERDSRLDVIRIIATFAVISVHFFLNNGFYEEIIEGKRMYIMVLLRNFFMICVPLFVLLTGYLMGGVKRELNKKYYRGLVKTLCIYVLASIACIIYKKLAGIADYDLRQALFSVLDFSGAEYSWYIEMYIGLYFLIPFLNLVSLNLDKREKKLLIVTLLLLTSVPTLVNIYNFDVEGWWQNPAQSDDYQQILPFYWWRLWPVTYYYIGNYLKEYQPRYSRRFLWSLIIVLTVATGTFNYYRSYNTTYIWGMWQEWGSFLNMILSIAVFYFFLQLEFINKASDFVKHILKKLSELTLGAYLVSYIFDSIFYSVLNRKIPEVTKRLEYYIVIVPLVFICSMFLSALLNLIYQLIKWIIGKLYYLLETKKTDSIIV